MNWNNVKNSDYVLALRSLITAFRKLQDLMIMTDNSEKKKVFISYAREDIETARRLYHDLEKAGLDPWIKPLYAPESGSLNPFVMLKKKYPLQLIIFVIRQIVFFQYPVLVL